MCDEQTHDEDLGDDPMLLAAEDPCVTSCIQGPGCATCPETTRDVGPDAEAAFIRAQEVNFRQAMLNRTQRTP